MAEPQFTFLLVCDPEYFPYLKAMVKSIAINHPENRNIHIHLHLINFLDTDLLLLDELKSEFIFFSSLLDSLALDDPKMHLSD